MIVGRLLSLSVFVRFERGRDSLGSTSTSRKVSGLWIVWLWRRKVLSWFVKELKWFWAVVQSALSKEEIEATKETFSAKPRLCSTVQGRDEWLNCQWLWCWVVRRRGRFQKRTHVVSYPSWCNQPKQEHGLPCCCRIWRDLSLEMRRGVKVSSTIGRGQFWIP